MVAVSVLAKQGAAQGATRARAKKVVKTESIFFKYMGTILRQMTSELKHGLLLLKKSFNSDI